MKIIFTIWLLFHLWTICFMVNFSTVEKLTLRRAKTNPFLDKLIRDLEKAEEEDPYSGEESDKTLLTIDPRLKPIISEWEERYVDAMWSGVGVEFFSEYFLPEAFRVLGGNQYQLEEFLERTLEILVHHLEPMFAEELDSRSIEGWLNKILDSLKNGTFWSRDWE
ncbi:MAG: hypothetical protein NC818_05855 [Candidatus Omnitrophica bacterium]|nr:hypothetical protein [Candidatus Omnitrophota bacterium]